jgi:hypothetical protein
MTVIEFPKPAPERTVADLLRDLAAHYEATEMPEALVYVTAADSGLSAGMMGHTDEIHACGLLTIGQQFLAQEAVGE